MRSLNSLILCELLFVLHFREFNSKPTRLKSVQIPVKLPTDEFGFPTGEYYPFMAYFVDKKEHDSEINRTLIGSAVIVTDRHALTAASVINKYIKNKCFEGLILLTGGRGAFCRRCRSFHRIAYAQHHPRFIDSSEKPFADIAVAVMKVQIPLDELTVISLSLENMIENMEAFQLGWDPDSPNNCKYNGICCGTKRKFYVSYITDNPYLFESFPKYKAQKDDHGGPVCIEGEKKLELIGITSKPSQTRNALHTKIFNFLPFIIYELKKDPVQYRYSDYEPSKWIPELLNSTILLYSPHKIL